MPRTPSAPRPDPRVAVLGDPLPCLRELRAHPEAESFADVAEVCGGHSGAVVGVDATAAHTRAELRVQLRLLGDLGEELCRRLPRLEHLIVLVHRIALDAEEVRRECDTAARRIHTRLEQAGGRSVIVTAVLTDGCDDYARLAERVLARSRQAESLDAGVALMWREIAHTPIGMVAANDYL
ncbi:hypothetical protein [Microbacterium lushaniae]|uniref:Uncharacterized protein n=1 Tax=Microbacterium lushaniae TaxID=2614639 RepID=A0A5J6L4N0_9MICO|nr:hypothetical protein [Microbacterium lushaniae]QEW03427.1 hypothetical protein F6J85_10150 [Microbacterium lushaniae]